MRFSLGERVALRSGGKGTVEAYEYKHYVHKYSDDVFDRYLVKVDGKVNCKWFNSEDVRSLLEINENAEAIIDKLVIDLHLDKRNFEALRELVDSE